MEGEGGREMVGEGRRYPGKSRAGPSGRPKRKSSLIDRKRKMKGGGRR